MSGYKFDTGIVNAQAIVNGGTLVLDLTGFQSANIYIAVTALNGDYLQVNLSLGVTGSTIEVGRMPKLESGDSAAFAVDDVSSGLTVAFVIPNGLGTATINYRIMARG